MTEPNTVTGVAAGDRFDGRLTTEAGSNWARLLRAGAVCLFWGSLLLVASLWVATVSSYLIFAVGLASAATVGPVVSFVLDLAGGLLYATGGWMLTTPDPGQSGSRGQGMRDVIRVAAVVAVGDRLIHFLQIAQALPPLSAHGLVVRQLVVSIIGWVGLLAMLRYLRGLSRRIPDEQLAGWCRVSFFGMAIPFVLSEMIGATRLLPIDLARRLATALPGLDRLLTLDGAVAAAFGVLYLVALRRFARRLRPA